MSVTHKKETQKWFYPLLAFMHDSRSIGIILLACTALSLLLSNTDILATSCSVVVLKASVAIKIIITKSLLCWVNNY